MPRLGSTFVLLMCLGATPLHAAADWGIRPNGQRVTQLADSGSKALVLFFVATDCPISNRTFPEMRRVREEFAAHHVQVWFVYPNAGEQTATVREHQQTFDSGGASVLDDEEALTRLAHARVTPEVSVLAPDGQGGWKPVYTGRVDDRYVRLGLERPAATQHFAEAAIQAVLEGGAPKPAVGSPVGCAIMNRSAR